jgi:hypothetical protein
MEVSRQGMDDVVIFAGAQTFALDTSWSSTGLPGALFDGLLQAFPSALPIPGTNQYSVDCSELQVVGTIRFTFGTKVITVPYKDFILQQADGMCMLGAFQSDCALYHSLQHSLIRDVLTVPCSSLPRAWSQLLASSLCRL